LDIGRINRLSGTTIIKAGQTSVVFTVAGTSVKIPESNLTQSILLAGNLFHLEPLKAQISISSSEPALIVINERQRRNAIYPQYHSLTHQLDMKTRSMRLHFEKEAGTSIP
jgi:hypothetical protein